MNLHDAQRSFAGPGNHGRRRPRSLRALVLVGLGCACGLAGCATFADLAQFDHFTEPPPDSGTSTDALDQDVAPDQTAATQDAPGMDGGGDGAALDAGDGGINLIVNASFEKGIHPWTTFADNGQEPLLGVSTAHAHTGRYSGWVSQRTAAFEGTVQDLTGSVAPGHTYSMTAWAMVGPAPDAGDECLEAGDADSGPDAASDAGDAGADVADAGSDAGDASCLSSLLASQPLFAAAAVTCMVDGSVVTTTKPLNLTIGNATTWTELYGVFTVPSATTCPLVSLQVYVAGPDPGVELFVDDVSVVP
jgi:hypothetical protein